VGLYVISWLRLNDIDAVVWCASYLAEDPGVVVVRNELLSQKKRLQDVQAKLSHVKIISHT
jgi:hypothetical protein